MESISKKWDEIKETLRKEYELSDISFSTWIEPLNFYEVKDNIVTILIPSDQAHALNYITSKYKSFFQVTISEMMDHTYDIAFILEKDAKNKDNDNVSAPKPAYNINYENANLSLKYKFDTFVVGSNNKLAHSASLAVAESPGEVYNPLYIYGGAGLGKTHLMHSIGHFILERNPDTKVIYVTSENFTNEVIDCIRSGDALKMNKFREKYRTVDVLMVDDIQFIIGKESTQQEFFFTFSHLTDSKKQVIISSDKHPSTMTMLDERYRSRFEMGITVDVKAPTYETRMAILRSKVSKEHIHIDDSILDYIASNINTNIRELQGAINKVISFSSLCEKEVTLELATEALADKINPNIKKEITIDYILETVADHFGISVKDILSNKRSNSIAYPRHICMYLCRHLIGSPLAEIGHKLGNRHHSTVLHSVELIEEKLKKDDAETVKNVDVLKKKIDPQ